MIYTDCEPFETDDGIAEPFCVDGYQLFDGFGEVFEVESYVYLSVFLDSLLADPQSVDTIIYMEQDYFYLPSLIDDCLNPYYEYIANPVGPPFALGACVEEKSLYSASTSTEGTHGPFELDNLAALAGPGVHHFLIDSVDTGGGFPTRKYLLTGTAYITYNYGPAKPIPLPAALPLLLGGVGALGLVARRRSRDKTLGSVEQ